MPSVRHVPRRRPPSPSREVPTKIRRHTGRPRLPQAAIAGESRPRAIDLKQEAHAARAADSAGELAARGAPHVHDAASVCAVRGSKAAPGACPRDVSQGGSNARSLLPGPPGVVDKSGHARPRGNGSQADRSRSPGRRPARRTANSTGRSPRPRSRCRNLRRLAGLGRQLVHPAPLACASAAGWQARGCRSWAASGSASSPRRSPSPPPPAPRSAGAGWPPPSWTRPPTRPRNWSRSTGSARRPRPPTSS